MLSAIGRENRVYVRLEPPLEGSNVVISAVGVCRVLYEKVCSPMPTPYWGGVATPRKTRS